jgi:predicted DNA-binding antitoxin AbrB/MazE fold protein
MGFVEGERGVQPMIKPKTKAAQRDCHRYGTAFPFSLCQSPSARSLQFPDHPESAQKIRSFGQIGFLKPLEKLDFSNLWCPRYPRNPIFWKNRISQTFGKIGFLKPLEKLDFSNLWKNRISQTFGKIRFLKPLVPKVPKKSDFLEKSDFSHLWKNRISQTFGAQGTQEIRFFGKIGFLKPLEKSLTLADNSLAH